MSPRNSGKLRSAAHRGQAEGAIGWIILSVLAVLIILPLGAVLLQIVSPGFFGNTEKADGMSLLFEVFEKPLWYKALGNSMSLGIWTTFFGTAFGAFLANFRVKWEFKTAKLLDIAAWILMIMPSFIIAQGWVYFASGNGIARSWLHWNNINSLVFSFPGLVFIMVLNKFPFAYVTIKAALEWKPERLSLAARMNGASPWEEWKTVQAPLCIPAYCSAAILIFMDTIGDFGLPAAISGVYRFPTLPYAIYTALYSSPIRLDMAGVLSFYLVLIIIAAMIVQYRIIGKKRYDFFDTGTVKAVPVRPAFGVGIILDFLGAFLAFITLFVPLGSTVVMSFSDSISVANFSFTLKNYEKVIVDSKELLNGLEHSLMIAFAAAIIGLVLGFFVSYVLNYSDFVLKRVIDVLSLVALAVPGVVLGIGYIFVWNQRWIESVGVKMYGTPRIIGPCQRCGGDSGHHESSDRRYGKDPETDPVCGPAFRRRSYHADSDDSLAALKSNRFVRIFIRIWRKRVQPCDQYDPLSAELSDTAGLHQQRSGKSEIRIFCGGNGVWRRNRGPSHFTDGAFTALFSAVPEKKSSRICGEALPGAERK